MLTVIPRSPVATATFFFITWWFTLTTLMNSLSVDAFSNPQAALLVVQDHLLNAMTKFQLPIMLKAIMGDTETVYDGAFWDTRSPISRIDNIQVPTFLVGAVHDLFQRGVPAMYEQLKDCVTTKMVILPGTHIEGAFMTTGLQTASGPAALQSHRIAMVRQIPSWNGQRCGRHAEHHPVHDWSGSNGSYDRLAGT